MSNIKLTSYSSGAGWACKINPEDLGKILENLGLKNSETDSISGFENYDDCSIFPLDENNLLIQSVDFFTPIVDDPYDFGRIAAANSLSDIYAMGGEPSFALNITCFPTDSLPLDILQDILRGGNDIAQKANISILGGHSIKDNEPKYGLVVTGIVQKKNLLKNNNLQIGDNLILTKPIGTGIISTSIKRGSCSKKEITHVTDLMTHLNKGAALAMNKIGANACTDITGYGLIGHLKEMCQASKKRAIINHSNVPYIDGAMELARDGVIPGGSKKNHEFFKSFVNFSEDISIEDQYILSDAQTSGGLLISVSNEKTESLIKELNEQNCISTNIIGKISKRL